MKQQILTIVAAATIVAFISGCAAKAPVMQSGKQVGIFVLSDRGIKSGMNENERNDRNEMGEHLEEDLVSTLKHDGYNAVLINNRSQFVQGPANYLVTVKINYLRLVGGAARHWAGAAPGPTILKSHYEVSGSSGKISLSYDDEDTTFRDWTKCPEELNERLVKKLNDKFVGKSK